VETTGRFRCENEGGEDKDDSEDVCQLSLVIMARFVTPLHHRTLKSFWNPQLELWIFGEHLPTVLIVVLEQSRRLHSSTRSSANRVASTSASSLKGTYCVMSILHA
jgi:hypothetical protein